MMQVEYFENELGFSKRALEEEGRVLAKPNPTELFVLMCFITALFSTFLRPLYE